MTFLLDRFTARWQRLGLRSAGLALAGLAQAASAQSWPAKPVTLVVPFPPGGTTDVLARALGSALSKNLGQSVIVDNRPGAGATIGADAVAKAKPDGYTLLMGAVHHTIASSVYKKLPYDFQRDLAPITTVAVVPNVLVVQASTPANNVAELVTLLKAQPDKATFGSNGNGTAQHLIGAQFQAQTGVVLTHIPYKGSGPMATDLLGGQILLSFDTITPVLQHIRSNKLRALAVTTSTRSPALPEVPTLEEAGLKGFNIGTWFGVLAPVATPRDIVVRLNTEMVKVIQSPEFVKRMEEIGAQPVGNRPEEMARQIKSETDKFADLVKSAKVVLE
ncbi:tripartite tricarboxylate transporter substrate binding protein [Curvibacter sp. HBC28]|uniref:Tripartite tricarboxylate transporter substrate binding protein n=1 Tax=Curvibacter microcysteis TaxID=3026419 RepID=A0ABT5MDU8_9BURK|nr:tripartite tricarboxylate transporter substrate binding protein [Curvibacter sp. HBC28]MDD0813345.1 tripartite tricarboxylate transporter substrate binding protein [Curvibacter sp. HBC28]